MRGFFLPGASHKFSCQEIPGLTFGIEACMTTDALRRPCRVAGSAVETLVNCICTNRGNRLGHDAPACITQFDDRPAAVREECVGIRTDSVTQRHESSSGFIQLPHGDDLLALNVEFPELQCWSRPALVAINAGDFDGVTFVRMRGAVAHYLGGHMTINARHAAFKVNIGCTLFKYPSVGQQAKLRRPVRTRSCCCLVQLCLMPAFIIRGDSARSAVTAKTRLRGNMDRNVWMMKRIERCTATGQFCRCSCVVLQVTSRTASASACFVDHCRLLFLLTKMTRRAQLPQMGVCGGVMQRRNAVMGVDILAFSKDELVHCNNAAHQVHERDLYPAGNFGVAVARSASLRYNGEVAGRERHSGMRQGFVQREWIAEVTRRTPYGLWIVRSHKASHPFVTCKTTFALSRNHGD